MIDRRPRMIVRCASVADVVAAVRHAREHDLEIGVRCGGHSIVGLAVPDDGLMIDLTPMAAVRVDPRAARAWIQGGALLGALDRATQPYGLATTAGNVSHTGVGGLTLGGGMGWLARQHGLACDNVVAFTRRHRRRRRHPRERRRAPRPLLGPARRRRELRDRHRVRVPPARDRHPHARRRVRLPRSPTPRRPCAAGVTSPPTRRARRPSPPTISGDDLTLGFVWVGDPARGRALLPALRALGRPVAERITEPSYLTLQRRDDTHRGPRAPPLLEGPLPPALPDAAIEALLRRQRRGRRHAARRRPPGLRRGDRRRARTTPPRSATAPPAFEYVAGTGWTDPDEDDARIDAARRSPPRSTRSPAAPTSTRSPTRAATGVRRAYPAESSRG